MNNIFDILRFEASLKRIVPHGAIEIPPFVKFGHLSFNGIMIAPTKKQDILALIEKNPFIERYEIVSSGFLNIFLKKAINFQIENTKFFTGKINFEYCSPNPTGDLHLGHLRNIILGFSISNLMKIVGYEVTTEMYINDQGNQMNQFLETVKYWHCHINKLDNPYSIFYKGSYVEDIARSIKKEINRENLVELLVNKIQKTLSKLKITHDVVSYESKMAPLMNEVIEKLKQNNLLYMGQLENQKTEGDALILKIGNIESVLQRSNGQFTYFAFDIAYHLDKYKRGFKKQICVLGEDHILHMEKLRKTLSFFDIDLKCVKYAMFHLLKNEQIIPMSKREGTILTVNEVLEQVDLDFLKWIILSYNNNKVIKFDINHIQTENPTFDINYVYMRLSTIEESSHLKIKPIDQEKIDMLYGKCIYFPILLRNAANNMDVHKLLSFTHEITYLVKDILDESPNMDIYTKYLMQKAKFIIGIAKQVIAI